MGMDDNAWCQYTQARFLFGSYSGAFRELFGNFRAPESIAHRDGYSPRPQGPLGSPARNRRGTRATMGDGARRDAPTICRVDFSANSWRNACRVTEKEPNRNRGLINWDRSIWRLLNEGRKRNAYGTVGGRPGDGSVVNWEQISCHFPKLLARKAPGKSRESGMGYTSAIPCKVVG